MARSFQEALVKVGYAPLKPRKQRARKVQKCRKCQNNMLYIDSTNVMACEVCDNYFVFSNYK